MRGAAAAVRKLGRAGAITVRFGRVKRDERGKGGREEWREGEGMEGCAGQTCGGPVEQLDEKGPRPPGVNQDRPSRAEQTQKGLSRPVS